MSHLKYAAATGHLLRNAQGHFVLDCDQPPAEPCTLDCSTLASAYTILGVSSLTGCAPCSASAATPWDGVVQQVGSDCHWLLNTAASIAGKAPSYSLLVAADCPVDESPNGVGIWLNENQCRWELAITCRTSTTYPVIWAGTKPVGTSPAGTYTRLCGCDTTATLTVT